MKQPTEAKVKKAVMDYLKLRNVRFWRMNSGVLPMGYQNKAGKFKQRMVRLADPGTPDFLVFRREMKKIGSELIGYLQPIWIEVKRPLGPKGGTGGSEQSPEQVQFQAEAERNGERYCVVRGVDDLVKALS